MTGSRYNDGVVRMEGISMSDGAVNSGRCRRGTEGVKSRTKASDPKGANGYTSF